MNESKIRTFPLFLIVLGVIILVENLGWLNNAWGKLWPLLLIVIGISSIYKSIEWGKN